MLKEMDIINAVRGYLANEMHYEIKHVVRNVSEQGIDLVVESPKTKVKVNIEAKGQTSSKDTPRFGMEFNASQKEDHLGRALLKSLRCISNGEIAAIALPGDDYDRNLVNGISKALQRLGVVVFLVNPHDCKVAIEVGRLPE